ncbi:MAG: ATP-binding protein [Methanocorpusculum sp.]|nr:ATP-binding protein [Methanocorpusculum sp.]
MTDIGDWVRKCAISLYDKEYSFPEKPEGDFSFGAYIANILADPVDEQHANLVVVGQSGMGKSTSALSIALSIARTLAEIFSDRPEDHFQLDTHVCILDPDTANNIKRMCATKMYQIYIIDEAADDTPARRAMSLDNLNNIKFAATVRTSRSCIIRCVQFTNLMDGAMMDQATHLIRIVEPHHKEGYNVVKIKEMKVFGDNPKPYKVYMKPNGQDKLVRHIIYAPELSTYTQYRQMRKEGADAKILEIADGPGEVEIPKRELVRQKCEKAWTDYLDASHPYKRLSRCARDAGVDPKTLKRWLEKNGYSESERRKE